MYFFHVVREKNAFEWFFELLSTLENENINNFLEIHTHLTSIKNEEEARSLLARDRDEEGKTEIESREQDSLLIDSDDTLPHILIQALERGGTR